MPVVNERIGKETEACGYKLACASVQKQNGSSQSQQNEIFQFSGSSGQHYQSVLDKNLSKGTEIFQITELELYVMKNWNLLCCALNNPFLVLLPKNTNFLYCGKKWNSRNLRRLVHKRFLGFFLQTIPNRRSRQLWSLMLAKKSSHY